MIGSILDFLYASFNSDFGEIPKELEYFSVKNKSSNDFWICFLPESILSFEFIKRKIISSRDTEIYVIPKTIIQPNPMLTRDVLERITEEAINQEFRRGEINLLGISLGNAIAYKFANVFRVDRFVSVVPGSFLPECI